jgi:hypothetical protein
LNSGINVTILLIPLLILLAIALLIRGRKRWIGSEPHCRKCNYLLHGLTSDRCPECGAILSSAAIVAGQPRRRSVSFISGWLIILLLAIFLIASSTSTFQNINWYQYKPTWLVLRDLNSQTPATVQTAWTELVRRDGLGSLSADARQKLVQFALTQQFNAKSPYTPFDTDTVGYLGKRMAAGDLPKEDEAKFFDQCVRARFSVRPIVIAGDFVPYQVADESVGPTNLAIKRTIASMTLDDRQLATGGGSSESSGFGSGTLSSAVPCPDIGEHQLQTVLHVEFYNGPVSGHGLTPIGTIDRALVQKFLVVPKNTPSTVAPAFDAKVESTILATIQLHDFKYHSKTHTVEGEIRISNAPVNIAADAFISYAGREQPLNYLTYNANNGLWDCGIQGAVTPPPPAKIDIVLRPSEKIARGTVDMKTYWNHELVFHDVPVAKN